MWPRLLQGRSFACLPRLRELRICAAAAANDVNAPDGTVHINTAGLPSELQTFEVRALCAATHRRLGGYQL